jgi:hypothetical protein
MKLKFVLKQQFYMFQSVHASLLQRVDSHHNKVCICYNITVSFSGWHVNKLVVTLNTETSLESVTD